MYRLDGKVTLLTGAAGGIGSATARLLAERGATLALVDRVSAAELAGELGGASRAFTADIGRQDIVDAMFGEVLSEYGQVDILINNAGLLRDKTLLKLPPEHWQESLDVNLSAAFYCSRLALPSMIEQGWGRIVSLSSISGITGNFGQTNYAAAKAGLIGFTKSLALEVARKGVTVNAVAPGFIDTAMMRSVPPEVLREFEAKIPVGRLGRPADVAEVIAFLVAPETEYLTGQTFHVNGGAWM